MPKEPFALGRGRWATAVAHFCGAVVKERWVERARRISSLMLGTVYDQLQLVRIELSSC